MRTKNVVIVSREAVEVFFHYALVCMLAVGCAICVIASEMGCYGDEINRFACLLTMAVSLYLCYKCRKDTSLFLVMLFITYSNYSIVMGVYFFPELRPGKGMYDQVQNYSSYTESVNCLLLFITTLLFLYRFLNGSCMSVEGKQRKEQVEFNSIIAIFAPVIYCLLFFLSYRMGDGGQRGSSSSINEYRAVIALIAFYYSGKKRWCQVIWTLIIVLTSLMVLKSGNRIDAFGSLFVLVMLWYKDILNYRVLLVLVPVGIFGMIGIGAFRAGFSLSNLKSVFGIMKYNRLTMDTAFYAYLPSVLSREIKDLLTIDEKLLLLWKHVCYVFSLSGGGSFSESLVIVTRQYYFHCMGFVSPVYFAFWIGYLGPIALAGLVAIYIRWCLQTCKKEDSIKKPLSFIEKGKVIFGQYAMISVARWYLYAPHQLFKGVFICLVAYSIVFVAHRLLTMNVKNESENKEIRV